MNPPTQSKHPRDMQQMHEQQTPLQKFAEGTTMHGMPRAIRATSTATRIFWSVLCLCAVIMFCVQFAQLLQKYFSYPKKVTVQMVPAGAPFPAISLCNMRNLDAMVLNSLNQIFITDSSGAPYARENISNNNFMDMYMMTVKKYKKLFLRDDLDWAIFDTVLTRSWIASNIDRELVTSAGIHFEEFLVTCQHGKIACNRTRDFTQFFDSYYYNCFTYRAPEPMEEDASLAEGLENGWSTIVLSGSGMLELNGNMRFIPGTHEPLSPISSSDGVRVVIHPPDTEPYPRTEGFDVPPGFSATLGVKARLNHRIGPPHGICSDADHVDVLRGHRYRLIACQSMCLQHLIVHECGCKDISLSGAIMYPDVKYCASDDDIAIGCSFNATDDCVQGLHHLYNRLICVRNITSRVAHNSTITRECGCYPPCDEVFYDVSYSLSEWPADNFDGEMAYLDIFQSSPYVKRLSKTFNPKKMDMYQAYFTPENRRRAMKDFARLNVYITDSNVLKTEESADYTHSHLLSDIGGQLGLWVGISVITIAEVIELIMNLTRHLFSEQRPSSKDDGSSCV